MEYGNKNFFLNIIVRKKQLKSDLASFYHGALFSPVRPTSLKAIGNGHLDSFPGLTKALIKQHLLPSVATTKGHQHQERQQL